jgi:hypothetical protein
MITVEQMESLLKKKKKKRGKEKKPIYILNI